MPTGMIEKIKDTLLSQTVKEIEKKLDPKIKDGYQAIVVAGMKVMFSDKTHYLLTRTIKEGQAKNNMGVVAVQGITRLIAIIFRESKGRMNIPSAFPAAITLLCYAFEFAENSTDFEIDRDTLANAVHVLTVSLLKLFKIDERQLAEGIDYNKRKREPSIEGEEMNVSALAGSSGEPSQGAPQVPPTVGGGV